MQVPNGTGTVVRGSTNVSSSMQTSSTLIVSIQLFCCQIPKPDKIWLIFEYILNIFKNISDSLSILSINSFPVRCNYCITTRCIDTLWLLWQFRAMYEAMPRKQNGDHQRFHVILWDFLRYNLSKRVINRIKVHTGVRAKSISNRWNEHCSIERHHTRSRL